MTASAFSPSSLQDAWMAAWPAALAAWSPFTRLRPPRLCLTEKEAEAEGLTGSFAMIRLADQAVVISLPGVRAAGIEHLAVEVLAHEVGHHVLAPANLTDHGRMIARMRWALPTLEKYAPMVANLYEDLIINDRLQRSAGLRIDEVYRALGRETAEGGGAAPGALWTLYLRIYEILWSLQRQSLGGGAADDRTEGDAWLGARLLRSYSADFLGGSGRFAALVLPYLLEDKGLTAAVERLLDTRDAGKGAEVGGLVEADPDERAGAVHPAEDGGGGDEDADAAEPREVRSQKQGGGQTREPFQYGEILRAMGLDLSDHEVAVRYYREKAQPHLVPFPARPSPQGTDPLPEGLEPWDIGDPLDAADWLQTVMVSPRVVPGMTTVQRVWGTADGREPAREPLDLDIYVDSSGSMANPQVQLSFPALAGAIICLSALRAGARVQATLWSGARQFETTGGFVRDERAILRVLTGYIGGATAFPIHILRDTFAGRGADARPVHILVVSDDGVSTMFDQDERGDSGRDVAAMALARGRGGGTFVLNLTEGWEKIRGRWAAPLEAIKRARDEQGWHVHPVTRWDQLVAFARAFSRQRFGAGSNDEEGRGRR